MTRQPTGPACGNNPNYRMSEGDRRAVEDFKAYLADRAALRDRIAEALERADYRPDMRRGDLADAIMPVLPPPADRIAGLREAYEIAYAEGMRLNALEAEIGVGPYRGALTVAHLLRKAISNAQQNDETPAAEEQPAEPRPPYEQLADRLDLEAARRTKAAWSPEEATAAREWGNVAAFIRGLAREEQPALGEQPETQETSAAVFLATRCDACQHTLNWHRNDVGCTVVLCVCSRFQQPAEEQPC
jgi:hypothetical protein